MKLAQVSPKLYRLVLLQRANDYLRLVERDPEESTTAKFKKALANEELVAAEPYFRPHNPTDGSYIHPRQKKDSLSTRFTSSQNPTTHPIEISLEKGEQDILEAHSHLISLVRKNYAGITSLLTTYAQNPSSLDTIEMSIDDALELARIYNAISDAFAFETNIYSKDSVSVDFTEDQQPILYKDGRGKKQLVDDYTPAFISFHARRLAKYFDERAKKALKAELELIHFRSENKKSGPLIPKLDKSGDLKLIFNELDNKNHVMLNPLPGNNSENFIIKKLKPQ